MPRHTTFLTFVVLALLAFGTTDARRTRKRGKPNKSGRADKPVNCYDRLGVSRSADAAEVKRAFRKLAREQHPDMVPPDKKEEAEQAFIELARCQEILTDDTARKQYDASGFDPKFEQRQEFNSNAHFAKAFEDLFGGGTASSFFSFGDAAGGSFFSQGSPGGGAGPQFGFPGAGGMGPQAPRRPPPKPTRHTLKVDLADLFHESEHVVRVRSGNGQKAKKVTVTVPAGAPDGHVIAMGALEFEVQSKAHQEFTRGARAKRADLHTTVQVTLEQALFGVDLHLDTLDGDQVHLQLDSVQPGVSHKVKRAGLPRLHAPDKRGHLFVDFDVVLPKLSKADKDKLRPLARRWRYPKQ